MPESETDVRAKVITPTLRSIGWEEPYISREIGRLPSESGVQADYFLYLPEYSGSVALVEAKREDNPLSAALDQALDYVQKLRQKGTRTALAFATDGKATLAAWHTGAPLRINGEDVRELQPPRIVRRFLEADSPNLIRGEVPRNSQMLVDLFKQASRVLHKEGIEVGRLHTQDGMFAIADREYHATQTFMALEVDESKANPYYIVLSLLSIADQMNRVDTTGREQYGKDDVLDLPVALPPLEEQAAVVAQWMEAVQAYIEAKANVENLLSGFGQEPSDA